MSGDQGHEPADSGHHADTGQEASPVEDVGEHQEDRATKGSSPGEAGDGIAGQMNGTRVGWDEVLGSIVEFGIFRLLLHGLGLRIRRCGCGGSGEDVPRKLRVGGQIRNDGLPHIVLVRSPWIAAHRCTPLAGSMKVVCHRR